MLVEFSVENYRSISERQTFSMITSKDKTMLDTSSFPAPSLGGARLLKSSVIYGANASGKTNVLRALYAMREIVTSSASQMQADQKLPIQPFRLNKNFSEQPTQLEAIFIHKSIRYQYGFSLDRSRIYSEWLAAYPKGRPQTWFTREYDSNKKDDEWYFGQKLKGEKENIKNLVRPNSLFLSHATQNNHPQLTQVFQWFRDKLFFIDFSSRSDSSELEDSYTAERCFSDKKFLELVIQFMNAADIDISSIEIESKNFKESFKEAYNSLGVPSSFVSLEEMLNSLDTKFYQIRTVRKLKESGELVQFPISYESNGTQRLFAIIGPCLQAIEEGRAIFIDELGKSLHPNLTMLLVKTFNSQETNKNSSQLIFSTHDTTLLDKTIFRRDQVWFTEKGKDCATKLYPLTDFKPRREESLQKGYLQGRYGAVPFVGKLQF